jgi:ribosomal protein S18 acetylase RimI-like enzyme
MTDRMLPARRDPDAPAVLRRRAVVAGVVVRLCRAEDLPRLEWFGLYSHHREILVDAFARQTRGENMMLVADLNEFPVGQAWVDLVKRRADGIGYVWAVRVFPLLQRLGLGTLLMQAVEDLLCDRRLFIAEVGVEKDNPEARKLYQRLGYTPSGELQEEYSYTTPDGVYARHIVDQWILRKRLDVRPAEAGE